jgi:hypothetical protein
LTTKIILLDTKHGTNRFGMKLGCFVALDSNGVTRVLAACFLLHQDGDSFKWTFSEFTNAFGCNPNVAFTDGDIAMAEAMVSWPGTTHLYCTIHTWKNFFTNIHPSTRGCQFFNYENFVGLPENKSYYGGRKSGRAP